MAADKYNADDLPNAAAEKPPTDYTYDLRKLMTGCQHLRTVAEMIVNSQNEPLDESKISLSEMSPSMIDAVNAMLKLARSQLYASGMFENITNNTLRVYPKQK